MSEKQLSEDQITTLPKSLVEVGVPLEFPIYDIRGQLLMQAGMIISSEGQLERLLDRGLYLNKKSVEKLRAGKTTGNTAKKEEQKEEEPVQKLVKLPLESIKLNESLQISPLTDENESTKYTVKFLGGLPKGSIICTTPKVDDKLIFVKEHAGFRVQLFSGKDVYSFTSIVEAVYNKPYPHLHLKFPSGVYSKNLRNNQRAAANIIASIVNKTEGDFKDKKMPGRIIDISLGGGMVESSTLMGKNGDALECTFKLTVSGTEVFFSIHSILRNVVEPSKSDDGQKFKHGIQFQDIPFQEKMMLQNYVYQLITGNDLSNL